MERGNRLRETFGDREIGLEEQSEYIDDGARRFSSKGGQCELSVEPSNASTAELT